MTGLILMCGHCVSVAPWRHRSNRTDIGGGSWTVARGSKRHLAETGGVIQPESVSCELLQECCTLTYSLSVTL